MHTMCVFEHCSSIVLGSDSQAVLGPSWYLLSKDWRAALGQVLACHPASSFAYGILRTYECIDIHVLFKSN